MEKEEEEEKKAKPLKCLFFLLVVLFASLLLFRQGMNGKSERVVYFCDISHLNDTFDIFNALCV